MSTPRSPAWLFRPAPPPALTGPVSRVIVGEGLRTLGLLAAMILAVGLLVQLAFHDHAGGAGFFHGLAHFLATVHKDKNGVLLLSYFPQAAGQTICLAGLALCLLSAASMVVGIVLARMPRWQAIKMVVLALSAVPSFVWPFVGYLLFTPAEFRGFTSNTALFWPALALAVGDLNLITVSTLYAEALRHEFSQPHARTAYVLRGTVWLDLWPRSAVAIVGALGARIPHLLGGTIALEVLYDIHGIGFLAWTAIVDVPPDYHVLMWVCGLGIIISRILYVFQRVLTLKLMPERTTVGEQTGETLDDDATLPAAATGPDRPNWQPAERGSPEIAAGAPLPQFFSRPAPLPWLIPLPTWLARTRYYLRLNPANMLKLLAAVLVWVAFGMGLAYCVQVYLDWQAGGAAPSNALSFQPASWDHPLGTNASGEDILLNLARGLRQQAPPLLAVVAISCLPALAAALLGVFGALMLRRGWAKVVHGVSRVLDASAEFIESFPKIVILLACVSYFTATDLIWKMYMVIGILFAPQVYRAIRDEVCALQRSQFVEAVMLARVPRWRVLLQNVLRNHCLHVLAVQAAVLVGCVVHVDAMLGFLGIRSRGQIFTWGSMLGMGIEEYMMFAPVRPFPEGIVWGPAVAVWLMILAMFTLADALKIPLGGYVYRLK